VSSGISFQILDKTIGAFRMTANATDPDGDPLSYFWIIDTRGGDFRQGDYASGQVLELTVGPLPARLPVSVLISDRRGGVAWARANLFGHQNEPPFIEGGGDLFDFSGGQFSENISDGEGDRLYFRWDFGDGQVGYVPNPRYHHENAGLEGVTVAMQVSDGESELTALKQVFPNVLPVADAGPNRRAPLPLGEACADVTLDGSASFDPDGTITLSLWFLGANFIGSTPQVTHCFPLGAHTVTLYVLDDGSPQGLDMDDALVRVKRRMREPDPKKHILPDNGEVNR
jgi:hypothetical protein